MGRELGIRERGLVRVMAADSSLVRQGWDIVKEAVRLAPPGFDALRGHRDWGVAATGRGDEQAPSPGRGEAPEVGIISKGKATAAGVCASHRVLGEGRATANGE